MPVTTRYRIAGPDLTNEALREPGTILRAVKVIPAFGPLVRPAFDMEATTDFRN